MKYLRAGQVYRRAELARQSKSIDRHLQELVGEGVLRKLSGGVYYCPRKTSFGCVPPEDEKIIRAFLKDGNFYIASLNAYNSLGVGTTQIYNERLVYNHKRDGRLTLAGRSFYFLKRPCFPKKSSREFLWVDLMNNLEFLAEDKAMVRGNVAERVLSMDKSILMKAVREFGGARTKKFFEEVFKRSSHAV